MTQLATMSRAWHYAIEALRAALAIKADAGWYAAADELIGSFGPSSSLRNRPVRRRGS